MKKILPTLLVASFFLTACGNPLGGGNNSKLSDNFQPGAPENVAGDPPAVIPAPVGGDTGMKIGPGAIRAAGNSLAMKAAVTTDDRKLSGTHLGARISMNKSTLR
ncbi:MAG: hypothetical protein EOP11_04595 [Proteobacteria bacterium]|nr:MAG: hypothetical protein EOP11_04595 [Pseudomonadota bacterium]